MVVFLALFDTMIGCCGIAWGLRGIAGVQLPEASDLETRGRMLHRFPDAREAAPPPEVALVVDEIAELLHGTPKDLSHAVLDMEPLPPFHRRIYEAARRIPFGATTTYGALAKDAGAARAARAAGQALARNPFPIIVPCHRVVAAEGKIGGFSAHGGTNMKFRLLAIERQARGAEESGVFAPFGAP
ncbi:MAG TPA: methylated-DNA--[protein]-cysteine S-methyltransferase [Methylocella sp.]|nr:methylated-DNA--[protein]-cysteine S-methyltransferase [Methylocella sp.]